MEDCFASIGSHADSKSGHNVRALLYLFVGQAVLIRSRDLSKLKELLFTIFEIRDDYMNLQSGLYTAEKDILMQCSEDEAVEMRAVKYMLMPLNWLTTGQNRDLPFVPSSYFDSL